MTGESSPPGRGAPGLYLHLPFCASVCPYCDFAVAVGSEGYRARFVAGLLSEIALGPPHGFERPFDTVYLGGGTPSLLEPPQLGAILEAAASHLPLAGGVELTLEANPEDVSAESLAAWRRLGIDRLSLGIQSFDDRALALLGRRHSAAEARRSLELALAAGFAGVSVDLIYGFPGQDGAALARDLDAATAPGPQHLSCYQLTVEPRSIFGHRRRAGRFRELPARRQSELFRAVHRGLEERGYAAYEVSSFAASGEHQSRHNRKYWAHAPYLGLGPSAHSFDGRRGRWWNVRKPGLYLLKMRTGERPIEEREELTADQLGLERLMLALRMPEGLDLASLRDEYGLDLPGARAEVLDALVTRKLVVLDGDRLRPTLEGLAVADRLALELAPDRPAAGWPGPAGNRVTI